MDIRSLWKDFVTHSKELLDRMCSSEGETLTSVELHILRVQLRLLNHQAETLQQGIAAGSHSSLSHLDNIKVLFIDSNDEERRSWADRLAVAAVGPQKR